MKDVSRRLYRKKSLTDYTDYTDLVLETRILGLVHADCADYADLVLETRI